MEIFAKIKAGHGRTLAEDIAYFNGKIIDTAYSSLDVKELQCIAIADGVGGNAGGREASQFVMKYLADNLPAIFDESVLRGLFSNLNNDLLKLGKVNSTPTMATTFTGLFCSGQDTYVVHVGNTRLAILQGEYIKNITKDQTTYQWLLDKQEFEAAENCPRSSIRGCLGGGNSAYADILEVRKIFTKGLPNVCIITSDGIHDYVDIDSFEEVLSSNNETNEKIDKLISIAGVNGSEDDKTVIILRNN